ncbi:MAG: hypothetical protein AAFU67_01075, partial [Bacteroidota bacterium]
LQLLPKLKFWESEAELFDLAQLALGLGPLFAVIVLGSNLYNGWRHMYFIYPSLLYLGVVAWQQIRRQTKLRTKTVVSTLLILNLLSVGHFMYRYHPNQQVYFNALAGSDRTKRYDMDYWGLSYFTALKKIVEETPDGEKTAVTSHDPTCFYNCKYLPPEMKAKLHYDFTGEEAKYYLSTFRRPKHHDNFFNQVPPHDRPHFFIRVEGEPIVGVFKLEE